MKDLSAGEATNLETESLRAMTYSHDGFGLGHFRRNANIAARLVGDMPASSVLMLVGCPASVIFQLPPGVDFVKIPSIIKVGTAAWHPRTLRIGLERTKAIRRAAIQKTAEIFSPHLVLVDHQPSGAWNELLPTLRMLKEGEDPPVIVLGLRDILDAPEVTRAVWRKEHAYEVIRRYYDEVFIYGCQNVFDTAVQYGLDAEIPGRFKYCGYVCAKSPRIPKEQTLKKLRLRTNRLVVVTAGGGYDAYPMMQTCLEAFRLLGKDLPFEVVLITGPLMEPDHRDSLRALADDLGIRVIMAVEDSISFINASDLVVTMGGYNSLCEVLSLQKKALVIPRRGPSAEQEMRARLLAERGLVDVLYTRDLSPRKLLERILADLERTDYPVYDSAIHDDGASQAASRLLELIYLRGDFQRQSESPHVAEYLVPANEERLRPFIQETGMPSPRGEPRKC